MNHVIKIFLALTLMTLQVMTLQVSAQTVTTHVDGNKAEILITLPGNIVADLTLTFNHVIGLTENNLGISADLINVNDLTLLSRLPSGISTSIPSAFPMMITIEPLLEAGFSFEGAVTIDIHTHNLPYTANTPLRLYKAPLGGSFRDITDHTSSGSYRARGDSGTFSQFLIVSDARLSASVTAEKLTLLQTDLSAWQSLIDAGVYSQLDAKVTAIASHINNDDYINANIKISELLSLISQNAGSNIPNIWRSSKDIVNVAGELSSQAKTLRYSMRLIN